ncbi:MAG: peptidoglycan-binding domain-containing protein, partial [Solimonas sp.]
VSDAAHVQRGDRGPFVIKIQSALNLLDRAGLDEDGIYGLATAKAVLAYKTARGIINRARQTQADDIVGKMTVAALDAELVRLPPIVPVLVFIGRPVLRILPPPALQPRPAFLAFRAIGDAAPVDPPNPLNLSAVVRGNPYVSANAQPFPGVPPSVPPRKTYKVDVTIQPALPAGQVVEIEIINGSNDNGTATVSPTRLSASGQVTVTGDRQTSPGHAGQLRVQAKRNGKILATSDGFSVCAHPSAVRITSSKQLVGPKHMGISVRIQIESDSDLVTDLDNAVMNELVEQVHRDSPPFSATGQILASPFYQKIGDGKGTDEHGFRPFPGDKGELVVEQVHVFKCSRCGAQHITIPRSGFEITGATSTDDRGKTWKFQVTRKATKTGVNAEPEDKVPKATFKAQAGVGDAIGTREVIRPTSPI